MIKFGAILMMCIFFAIGCASVSYRLDSSSMPEISSGPYPGTRLDINLMEEAFKGEIESSHSLIDPLVFAGFLTDVPLSFLVDTIFLPYDVFQIGKDKFREKKTEENSIK